MTLKEIREWELQHKVKVPALKRYKRKEQLQEKLYPYKINWDKLTIQAEPLVKQAKEKLKQISEF